MSQRPSYGRRRREDGQILVLASLLLTFVVSIVLGSLSLITTRVQDARVSRNQLLAGFVARSGVQRQVANISEARDLASMSNPWATFDGLDTNTASGVGGFSQTYSAEPLLDAGGGRVGEYDVFVDVQAPAANRRLITITSYAYVPSKQAFDSGVRDAARADATTVAEVSCRTSEVFDYSYFINHWGWFYGDTIIAEGNVRSNGIFDFGGYASTVNGSPRFQGSDGAQLSGYMDDNGDGVTDGSDGGAYSPIAIIGAENVQGMAGSPVNQHVVPEMAPMPNLADLSLYETKAIEAGGSIQVGSTTYVSGVLGDDSGEKQNLFLVGTATNPIVLDGPVVVRGSVVISGYVTGKGSIYCGDNVYIPRDLNYLDGPSTLRPAANDEASIEAWRESAMDKDSLGLFSREHIVVGDYTHSWWQYYVSSWVNHPGNKSAEDAGIDGIQNTSKGADGVSGTADDDLLEDDGVWTVSYYTAEDEAKGLIPPGKAVGDVVPGSGEDIDGDGGYDGPTQMSEFALPAALNSGEWAGNIGSGYSAYNQVATIEISRIDAVLYTNHTLGALMINWDGDVILNGSVVSRNESIVYGAEHIVMNHDERLSGRGTSSGSGFESPLAWDPVKLSPWQFDQKLPADVVGDPALIEGYYTGAGVN